MPAIDKDIVKRLTKILAECLAINNKYGHRHVTFKVYQDRIELIVYKSDLSSNGILYDADFKLVDKTTFYTELEKIEKVLEGMR